MKIKAEVWEEDGVWCASVPALPGCHTCADTFAELKTNIQDAVEGWLEVAYERKSNIKPDNSFTRNTIELAL